MAQHLKCSHKKKPDEGVNFHVIKESFIPCQICSLDMFHTDGEIRRHLTRYHSMTLEDYAEMYVSDGVLEMSIPEPINLIEGMMTPKNIPWYHESVFLLLASFSLGGGGGVRVRGWHAVSFILRDLFWPTASRAYLPLARSFLRSYVRSFLPAIESPRARQPACLRRQGSGAVAAISRDVYAAAPQKSKLH